MHIKTTMGNGIEICAERDRDQYTDWNLSVSKTESIQRFDVGILRFFEGRILLRYPSEEEDISKFLGVEIHQDLYLTSLRRVARMVSMFLDVEFVMEK